MKASVGFIFFMLFLAGIALVNLISINDQANSVIISAEDIAYTSWRPTHIGEMRLPDDTVMSLQFDSRTSLAGHAGCNRFFGDYTLMAGTLEIAALGSTRMACPEPAASLEFSFLQALQNARSLSRVGTRMALKDNNGENVARFVSASQDEEAP